MSSPTKLARALFASDKVASFASPNVKALAAVITRERDAHINNLKLVADHFNSPTPSEEMRAKAVRCLSSVVGLFSPESDRADLNHQLLLYPIANYSKSPQQRRKSDSQELMDEIGKLYQVIGRSSYENLQTNHFVLPTSRTAFEYAYVPLSPFWPAIGEHFMPTPDYNLQPSCDPFNMPLTHVDLLMQL